MGDEELKAKVFISCGQRCGTDEERIAKEIERKLCCLGYEPYRALGEQSPRSVREEIFEELKTSEYFLFIDFKRERLVPFDTSVRKLDDTFLDDLPHRGSLFTNQELAIASYLELPIIAFQENGVLEKDGIMSCMQLNLEIGSTRFTERDTLVERVIDNIKDKWDPRWKNQLRLERDRWTFREEPTPNTTVHCHIHVKNLHRRTTAVNCQVYLKWYRNVDTGEKTWPEIIELKWAGYPLPTAAIFPQSERRFDAFFMWRNEAHKVHASSFADHGDFLWEIEEPGEWDMKYVVYSETLPPRSIKCRLHLPEDPADWDHMHFEQIDPSGE